MKIAIYDNLANNAYIQAKVLRRHRLKVDLILDSQDRFIMSDPRWEEISVEVSKEKQDSYQLPSLRVPWVRNLDSHPSKWVKLFLSLKHPRALVWALRFGGWQGVRYLMMHASEIELMSKYDLLITYGLGPILAAALGKRFIAATWGGDISIVPFYDTHPGEPAINRSLAKMQRQGYRSAFRIFLSEPRYLEYASRLNLTDRSVFQPLLVDIVRYSPFSHDLRAQKIRQKYLRAGEKHLIFMPSRQDWVWKGSDQAFKGLAKLKRHDFRILTSGWGTDYNRSIKLAKKLGLEDRVTFSKEIFSKRRLLDYYRAADMVLDQFTLDSYGTAGLEAMSTGKPLVISLNEDNYRRYFSAPPPVVNVHSPDEIASKIEELLERGYRAKQLGLRERSWVVRNHYREAVQQMRKEISGRV